METDIDIEIVNDQYELVRTLANSGQGVIYEARLRSDAPQDQGFQFAFKVYKEASQSGDAMLNETEILHLLEDRQVNGVPRPMPSQEYRAKDGATQSEAPKTGLLSKFKKGEDLGKILEAKRRRAVSANSGMEPWRVELWVEKLCKILADIHKQNVIHGDIKPSNILWDDANDVVSLIDFGSAVRLPGGKHPRSYTPPYASPSCLAGHPPSKMDDVYALGVTIFELLAGKQQFPVSLDWDPSDNQIVEDLSARLQNLDVAGEFEKRGLIKDGCDQLYRKFARVIQRCLSQDPEEQFQSFGQVAAVLNVAATTRTFRPGPTHDRRVPRRKWLSRAAVVLALLGLVALGGWAWVHPNNLKLASERSAEHGIAEQSAPSATNHYIPPPGTNVPAPASPVKTNTPAPPATNHYIPPPGTNVPAPAPPVKTNTPAPPATNHYIPPPGTNVTGPEESSGNKGDDSDGLVETLRRLKGTIQERLDATDAARLNGLAQLAQQIRGVKVSDHATYFNMALDNKWTEAVSSAVVRGARVVRYTADGDDLVSCIMQIDLQKVVDNVHESEALFTNGETISFESIQRYNPGVVTVTATGWGTIPKEGPPGSGSGRPMRIPGEVK